MTLGRVSAILGAVGALITIVVLAVFVVPRSAVAGGVTIVTDGEPLRCEGTEVVLSEADDSDSFRMPLAVMKPEMDCRLRFFVVNDSGNDVTIDRITMPGLGPGGGSGAEITHLNPTYNSSSDLLPDSAGATWIVDDELVAGDRRYYEFFVAFRPDGCTSPGASIGFNSWPELSVLFRTMEVPIAASTIGVGFLGTEFSSCDG